MNIKLNNLKIENVKGVKSFEVELDGDNAVIKAENGVGKTTIYDDFLWLLFGKNSEGKKDFKVRPLDKDNQPIKGLVVATEAELDCDGTVHTFRKEQHEKVVKKQFQGYETLCWIDEVPKKVGEYQDYITKLIPEDTFKLLTDLNHFNSKLHWTDRRKVLLDIADEVIDVPEGFDELDDALAGRTVDEYKKVLSEQKKRHEKERSEINPRIDEIHRGLEEYIASDTANIKGLTEQRDKINAEITELDAQRQKLFDTERERQTKIEYVNQLKTKKVEREAELKGDTSGTKDLFDEKIKIEADVAAQQQIVVQAKTNWTAQQTNLSTANRTLDSLMIQLHNIRDEYSRAYAGKTDDTCYACGQKLPKNKVTKIEEERKASLDEITKRGNEIMADVDRCKKAITELEAKIKELTQSLKKAEAELQKAKEDKDKRFVKIDEAIKTFVTTPPDKDPLWKALCFDIRKAENLIGEPVSEQLQQIDDQRTVMSNGVAQIDKALAHADRMKQDKTRIEELERKEKDLAQLIANLDKQLSDIDRYKATESRMIEQAVNGKFKHVEFKMFNRLINGGLEECCEATLNGVPYSDMSSGQQIFVGIDIVNVLSAHYGVAVPMFIDHSESLTLPIEAETQIIKLFAEKGTKTLVVEREELCLKN